MPRLFLAVLGLLAAVLGSSGSSAQGVPLRLEGMRLASMVPLAPSDLGTDPSVAADTTGLGSGARVVALTPIAASYGALAGTVGTLALVMADFAILCGPFGCSDPPSERRYVLMWTAASAAGAVLSVVPLSELNEDVAEALGLRRGDVGYAVLGALAGSVVGLAVADRLAARSSAEDPILPYLAVPVLQGVGIGVTLAIRP